MKRATNRFVAVTIVLSVLAGCATSGRGGLRPLPTPVASLDDYDGLKPTRVNQSDIGQQDVRSGSVSAKDTMLVIRRQLLKTLTPLATALSVLSAAPVYALQQLEPRSDNRPLVRRSARRAGDVRRWPSYERNCFSGRPSLEAWSRRKSSIHSSTMSSHRSSPMDSPSSRPRVDSGAPTGRRLRKTPMFSSSSTRSRIGK